MAQPRRAVRLHAWLQEAQIFRHARRRRLYVQPCSAATKIDLTSRGRAYSREQHREGASSLRRERVRELTKLGELRPAVPEAAANRACTGAGETKRRPADTCMQVAGAAASHTRIRIH